MAKGSVQGKDFLAGASKEGTAESWADTVAELADQIVADFFVPPPLVQGRIPNEVRQTFLIVALWAARQNAEMVRAHLKEKGQLRNAIRTFDRHLADVKTMRDVIDHMDEWSFGVGRNQTVSESRPAGGKPLGPVLALLGPSPYEQDDTSAEDYFVLMLSDGSERRFSLEAAVVVSRLLAKAVHDAHHDCTRCFEPGYRCFTCNPMSPAEIEEAFQLPPRSARGKG